MGSNIKSISSNSHAISFELSGNSQKEANVQLSSTNENIPRKDFLLNIKLSDIHKPSARIQEDIKGNQVIMASFSPRLGGDGGNTAELFIDDTLVYSEFVPKKKKKKKTFRKLFLNHLSKK